MFLLLRASTIFLQLQWGHALSGMDTAAAVIAALPPRCFNGAMPFQAWIPAAYSGSTDWHGGFNGAMPFQAWILEQVRSSWKVDARFNGAMPFQAWIPACECLSLPIRAIQLQWGHALSGMDTRTGLAVCNCHKCASMGPCPFRHGYAADAAHSVVPFCCFNGAMPFQAWIHESTGETAD